MTWRTKRHFAFRILKHRLRREPSLCPYCGRASDLRLLKRKKLILNVIRCETCKLIFRWPLETPEEAQAYYQLEYDAGRHPQTDLPGPEKLAELVRAHFSGSPLDLGSKIKILQAIRPTGRVLDYGCSWGYGTYQLARHGYQAVGYEISEPRARYARENLHLEIVGSAYRLRSLPHGSFDVIFSNHVLEHLLDLKSTFDLMAHLLAAGGLLFHVLPNFTGRGARTGLWLKWIGEEHPLAPTIEFFERNLPSHGFGKLYFDSTPFATPPGLGQFERERAPGQIEGDELLLAAWRTS